jgi:hypothetical protein
MPALGARKTFLLGVGIGLVVPTGMALTGTLDVFFTPLWQKIVFFPGFVAGDMLYRRCGAALPMSQGWCEEYGTLLVGIAAVGLTYGLVAIGIRTLLQRFNRSTPA